MIAELLSLKGAWGTFAIAVLVFGFAPGFFLRIIVCLLPKTDLRRKELLSELYAVPRMERPFWVAQQLEFCVFEGFGERFAARSATRRAAAHLAECVQCRQAAELELATWRLIELPARDSAAQARAVRSRLITELSTQPHAAIQGAAGWLSPQYGRAASAWLHLRIAINRGRVRRRP